jgi:predicted MarR family transcription regulator
MLDHMACDEDRHKLLNTLCKMCSRQRMIPRSVHVGKYLNGEMIEEYGGGDTIVYRTEHNGRSVAVKTADLCD